MTTLSAFTHEIAVEFVEGFTRADRLMAERELLGSAEQWRQFQRNRIIYLGVGLELALWLLAEATPGRDVDAELGRLQQRLAVGFSKRLRERDQRLSDALDELIGGA